MALSGWTGTGSWTLVYRCGVCDSTGYSPFRLLYGRDPVKPQDILLSLGPERDFETDEEYATHTSSTLAAAYSVALRQQLEAAKRNRLARSRELSPSSFFPGQRVFYWQPAVGNIPHLSMPDDHRTTPKKWRYACRTRWWARTLLRPLLRPMTQPRPNLTYMPSAMPGREGSSQQT